MYRCVCELLLLFSTFRSSLGYTSAVTRTVIPGENITLHCSMSPSTDMAWYRQINDELTMIISTVAAQIDKELIMNYNQDPEHFLPLYLNDTGHALSVSLSLIIVDIRQSDLGLYYCGARLTYDKQRVVFSRGVSLHFKDAVTCTSESAQYRTSLISVCCALVLMIIICLCLVHNKGLPSFPCMMCVKDNRMMEEENLQYASLRHSATPLEYATRPPNPNVIYDTIVKRVPENPQG